MALQKITEKTITDNLKEDAHLLVSQTETVSGQSVESLRRVPVGTFIEEITDIVGEDIADLKSAMNRLAKITNSDDEDVDLDITDPSGNVLARLKDGNIQTKEFDSSELPDMFSAKLSVNQGSENSGKILGVNSDGRVVPVNAPENGDVKVKNATITGVDLAVTDNYGNVLAEFANGHIRTKEFNSANEKIIENVHKDIDLALVDGQGNVLAEFYDGHIRTNEFDSADVAANTEAIAELSAKIYDQYEVPSYWMTTLLDKENAINVANMSMGDHGVSFIFFTDYHYTSNNLKSLPLLRHVADHTSITEVIYGGDTIDGGTLDTPAQAKRKVREIMEPFKPLQIKPVRGNHDCEPSANQTKNQIDVGSYYDIFVRPVEKDVVANGKPYFYFDNDNQKVRYVIMDSGGMNDPLDSTQLGWLKTRLTELDSAWTVLIFQHWVVEGDFEAQEAHLVTRGTKTLNAIGEVYSQLNCTIAAFICGHVHADVIMETDYNFPLISTTTDSAGANSAYDWDNPVRPAGTTNEQAFDVFTIDTTNHTITITRIGAGSDRIATY